MSYKQRLTDLVSSLSRPVPDTEPSELSSPVLAAGIVRLANSIAPVTHSSARGKARPSIMAAMDPSRLIQPPMVIAFIVAFIFIFTRQHLAYWLKSILPRLLHVRLPSYLLQMTRESRIDNQEADARLGRPHPAVSHQRCRERPS